jgi:type II secretory pathway pseudopilin PulG
MSVTPVNPPRGDVRHEHGFTLIEMLVTMVTGMVIIIATLTVLDVSISQSSRISERVDADQQGRLAMEKIVLGLHSSCIDSQVTPIQEGSTPTSIIFFNYVGSEPYVSQVVKHVIGLNIASGKLTDEAYKSTSEKVTEGGRTWTFPALPTSTQTLATNVSKSAGEPVFKYYAYAGGNLSTTPLVPEGSGEQLNTKQAEETAQVTIRFTAAPTFGRKPATEQETLDHTADLSDSVVLRLDPASASGTNEPCE